MRDKELFQLALGLRPPWYVASCEFDPDKHRLDISRLISPRAACLPVPVAGERGAAHTTRSSVHGGI